MASQYGSGEKEEWKVVSMCGLHRFEQGLFKRPFPHASNRSVSGCNCGPSSDEFLGCLSRVHQIPLALGDQEKTAFITPTRNYHYKVMPFGLKNAGSTYQKMMTRMFKPQLGKNIEIYINDMVVKSKVVFEYVGDLGNIFEILRRHKLRLNASKCSFGVNLGKFLDYMVTHRGIEVNPDQIKAINNLQPPQNPKEVQKLTGMIVTLNRFISRSANRCRPFFQLLHKWKGFEWTEECALVFYQLKEYLSQPPSMSRSEKEEVLFAYVVIASHTASLVLIQVDSNGDLLKKSLDLIKERKENVMVQLAYYQQKLK